MLISTNGGASWSIAGNSETVLAGAQVTAMAVDANNPNIVYVAVATGGEFGAGLYKSTLVGGQLVWTDVLTPSVMAGLAAGTPLASVTSVVIDPANANDVIVGIGNIGLTGAANASAGVWISSNLGASWSPMVGGNNPAIPNDTVPSGVGVGRVTVAEGLNVTTDIPIYYVLIGSPPPATPPATGGSVNYGGYVGLYKTKDGGLNFTKVQLNQATAPQVYSAIDLLGADAGNVGRWRSIPRTPTSSTSAARYRPTTVRPTRWTTA